ncbi:histidine phosphatase family protein [Chelativorans sp.]|uniref:histidine phosphatase family protein n=1 Tax=Chelativorans sp. TaxID=2203393 RepID=UPI00281146DC|nr:histidine phosphatase family protein [Chelativorans sp.]
MFHLLRHASHGHVGRVLTGRLPGAPLTGEGREEALALGRHMAGEKLDAIYASPRLRAQQTAEIIARETRVESRTAEELDEIDFGGWSGRSFDDLAADPAWRIWNEERGSAATPAGDTMERAAARITGFMERLCRERAGQHLALVSHCDVIKAALCRYLDLPFQSVHGFEIAPASITTLAIGKGGATLIAQNVRPAQLPVGALA